MPHEPINAVGYNFQLTLAMIHSIIIKDLKQILKT